jgi:ribosome-associated toxin RatA of RatAB toxin-antitoxin module
VQIVRELDLPASAARAFALVEDLERYPSWMGLVHEATVAPASATDPDGAPAWIIELQAQVGPFARSKRLRMVRTAHEPTRLVRFERNEIDGRSHAAWTLQADLVEVGSEAVRLTMTLTYGGSLWTGAVLQRVLDDEVRKGSDSLLLLVQRE